MEVVDTDNKKQVKAYLFRNKKVKQAMYLVFIVMISYILNGWSLQMQILFPFSVTLLLAKCDLSSLSCMCIYVDHPRCIPPLSPLGP